MVVTIFHFRSYKRDLKTYHGKGKDWKKEAVLRSPLLSVLSLQGTLANPSIHRWYNIPPDPSKLKAASTEAVQESGVTQSDLENSHPLDFETFVPNHDPSLAQPSQAAFETYAIPPASGEHVSRDEAFNRALSATYWAGYWTAVYHVSYTTPLAGPIPIQCAHSHSRVMDVMTEKALCTRWP